jgi:hypothetical protein
MSSANGVAAQTACIVLTLRQVESTMKAISTAGARLERLAFGVACLALLVGVVSLFN